jgi:hypothetical protein
MVVPGADCYRVHFHGHLGVLFTQHWQGWWAGKVRRAGGQELSLIPQSGIQLHFLVEACRKRIIKAKTAIMSSFWCDGHF